MGGRAPAPPPGPHRLRPPCCRAPWWPEGEGANSRPGTPHLLWDAALAAPCAGSGSPGPARITGTSGRASARHCSPTCCPRTSGEEAAGAPPGAVPAGREASLHHSAVPTQLHATQCHYTPRSATQHCAMPCHRMPCNATQHRATQSHATLQMCKPQSSSLADPPR